MSQNGAGVFFPCDDSTMVIHVRDSALSTGYHELAGSTNQPVLVPLRGVRRDSGSNYGGRQFLDVREVIEIRVRGAGECPGIAPPSESLQTGS
jgi:hypothetical protein